MTVAYSSVRRLALLPAIVLAAFAAGSASFAHCDTLDGPVAVDARAALDKGDPALLLKWVHAEQESELRAAFASALAARAKGPEAKDLADRYLLETAVRLHRASEGAPYTGLKPAGLDPGPAVRAADQALSSGNLADLVELTTDAVALGLERRFKMAVETKRHAGESVAKGREFVAAYVEFVHYAEGLLAAAQAGGEHAHAEAAQSEHRH
jgi:hypothetical protein